MEIVTMGKVVVAARIDNLRDVHGVDAGVLRPEEARYVEVPDVRAPWDWIVDLFGI